MKQILIDIYKTKNLYSGLGQFSINYAYELVVQCPSEIDLSFLVPTVRNNELGKKAKLIQANTKRRYFPSTNTDYDIWHSLHQFPSHFPNNRTKQILTIHDLNFLIEKQGAKKEKYLKRLQKNVDRADYLTTISNYTKSIIEYNIDLKGKPIRVIYNGVKVDSENNSSKPDYLGDKKFFFTIGIFNSKKNFHVLLPILKHLDDYNLIIAGDNNTDYGREIKSQIDKLGLKEQVILPGKISEADKNYLYKHCQAFLFPSLAEGFGMPVIEAMMFGKPVFLSKETCLPEIGGEHAFYFNDFDEAGMASIIEEKLKYFQIENLSESIIQYASKFNWQNSIKEYLKLYLEILTP